MLRTVALILLPILLLAAACGGSSDGANAESDEDSVEAIGPAGPDGIYNSADDSVVGDSPDRDGPADGPASFAETDGIAGLDDDSVTSTTGADDGNDGVVIADSGSDPESGTSSLGDNVLLGALNPFSLLDGMSAVLSGQDSFDPGSGAALLTAADVPNAFLEMGEFAFSIPSEFGDMDMAARMFATSDDPDEAGAMLMSAAMTLPQEAMGELDELMGFADADVAELQEVFSNLQMLDADSLGDGGFGIHMDLDFGSLFGAFGAPEDDSLPTGIAMDMYAFAVRDQVLVLMVMWPMGESPGVDALALAEIMASRV